ncbi:tellurite-resistance/dicarboxylate transporter family protein [Aspergillus novofumigatus IBT 16806]|uniref:Putative C4-dicarboxylate transporter/malic acid transport protein n=1 Tax=Aspergillus novofumigatus (strain IBT 16806) TaxID=1392255 RepID=A0A2I1CPV2_ASPN1|nr:putative C4-dicarboxylate transporter/malic acid transport protein [Aspergillus novofumigatus IBT 16806]PKX99656.1 putative C4-dicarboxylate transporter/malic acid transport protein [Aspergillus novofumigatus IBT 16806]
MATGGIAVLLSSTPHQFPGLKTIGKIVYILNLALFLGISACLIIRFLTKCSALKESFQEPNESHFMGTCLLALATIILGAENYGTDACDPWLQVALRIVFWIYVALSTIQAIWHNWYLYHIRMASRQPFALVRLLPSFPAMLAGTIASVLASHQPRFGFIMSLFIYAEYFYRLNKDGLPKASDRPEMFIAVGPWSFTALALIGMAEAAVKQFPERYIISYADASASQQVSVTAGDIALVLAALVAIFLWTMAAFCLCIAVLSVLAQCRVSGGTGALGMSLPYWSMVFPNTGFVIATIRIGQVLQSPAILWVATGLTIAQVVVWLCVGVGTIWAVATRRMLWPETRDKES